MSVTVDRLGARRTRLVQRTVRSLSEVNSTFSSTGRDGLEVCLVIVPDEPLCCCCTLLTQVPSGPWAFLHHFGAVTGLARPGAYWCLPMWDGVSHLVSKQIVTFNAKPKSVPTLDNVFVNVDLSITLRIGPDAERVHKFLVTMGAARLDAYLSLQIEESIRTLVYGVPHGQVNDLRGAFGLEMLRTLQAKMMNFGVELLHVKITDVALPYELQERLEKTTAFKTRLLEEEKNHEHMLQQLHNQSEQAVAEIVQSYKLEVARTAAEAERYEIEMDQKKAEAISERSVAIENAKAACNVQLTKAKDDAEVAVFQGRTAKHEAVEATRIKCQEVLRSASNNAQSRRVAAAAAKASGETMAAARLREAETEGLVASNAANKRRFEQQLKLAAIDTQLAHVGRKLVSGDAGASITAALVAVRADVMASRE